MNGLLSHEATYARREADAAAQLHGTRSFSDWWFQAAGNVDRKDLGAEPKRGTVALSVVGLGKMKRLAEVVANKGLDMFGVVRGAVRHLLWLEMTSSR